MARYGLRKAWVLFFVASVYVGLNAWTGAPRLAGSLFYPPLAGTPPAAVYGWPFAFYPSCVIEFPASSSFKGYRAYDAVNTALLVSDIAVLLVLLWILKRVFLSETQPGVQNRHSRRVEEMRKKIGKI